MVLMCLPLYHIFSQTHPCIAVTKSFSFLVLEHRPILKTLSLALPGAMLNLLFDLRAGHTPSNQITHVPRVVQSDTNAIQNVSSHPLGGSTSHKTPQVFDFTGRVTSVESCMACEWCFDEGSSFKLTYNIIDKATFRRSFLDIGVLRLRDRRRLL